MSQKVRKPLIGIVAFLGLILLVGAGAPLLKTGEAQITHRASKPAPASGVSGSRNATGKVTRLVSDEGSTYFDVAGNTVTFCDRSSNNYSGPV